MKNGKNESIFWDCVAQQVTQARSQLIFSLLLMFLNEMHSYTCIYVLHVGYLRICSPSNGGHLLSTPTVIP